MRIRPKRRVLVETLLQQQRIKYDTKNDNEGQGDRHNRRDKLICQVVEKVALWRKFYMGFIDDNGRDIQHPLQVSARQVGIAKKTLDDYLLQIRCGKKYGFDFDANSHHKIGVLRQFVKKQKQQKPGHDSDGQQMEQGINGQVNGQESGEYEDIDNQQEDIRQIMQSRSRGRGRGRGRGNKRKH